MKSSTLYVCVTAVLLIPAIAFGEIIEDGCGYKAYEIPESLQGYISIWGNSTVHYGGAYDDGYPVDIPEWPYDFFAVAGDGWEDTYTTENGLFYWEVYLEVLAGVELFLDDDELDAEAYAYAEAEFYADFGEVGLVAEALVLNDDYFSEDSDYDSEYISSLDFFFASEGISCTHNFDASVDTQGSTLVPVESENTGLAAAYAQADGNMWMF